ncbi:Vacuolar-sorting protein SNF8 [Hondaea fermentalgiana]|uniref:Vacuolar-sorting protein SNF8 n=1 Tax=Hondaea fermentalgiana TaxID=2315210 RepID=A0A2R5GVF6_9STRA|nr:Vacuolar-sorting protein SNF8 [Hondaea fermentalgiana]|eukprot:GBG34830.1 Vacuolar-sorting protein SNF8 [Hondaea fermentalgiana]
MRRNVGVARAVRARKERDAYQGKGAELNRANLEHFQTQMAAFKRELENFAVKHKKQINKDPEFRNKFQNMCSKVGVDPLASNKGFWAEVLGVGSFFYELGVQIIHVCLATRDANGGIIQFEDLLQYLRRIRQRAGRETQQISEEDVQRAIASLEPLGNGLRTVKVGPRQMLVSVPMELSPDHTTVLEAAQTHAGVLSIPVVQRDLGWSQERAARVLDALQAQGMTWVDKQTKDGVPAYEFPSIQLNLM